MTSAHDTLAIDLGKSRCRVAVVAHTRSPVHDGPGAPGLASAGGVDAALDAILSVTANLDLRFDDVSVGAAGAWFAPAAASDLAHTLAARLDVPVVVASDVVTAHAGGLGGRAGVLLIAGTGAAALGIDADGARLIDGWGPELGDLGSGSWLGRESLRAVLRASVDLGPRTVLTDEIRASVGEPGDIQAWLAKGGSLPRRLASLAPLVLDAAAGGDAVAADVVREGIRLLTATAAVASSTGSRVAVHGGLTEHVWFRDALVASLRAADRSVSPSRGDAIDGARLIALRRDLPHERFVHRAE